MVFSVSGSHSKFDLLKCGTQRGHVSNRSGTFKVANLRGTLSPIHWPSFLHPLPVPRSRAPEIYYKLLSAIRAAYRVMS